MTTEIVSGEKLNVPVTKVRRPSTSSTLSTSIPEINAGMPPPPPPIKAILYDDPKRRSKSGISSTKPVGLFSHLAQYSGRDGEKLLNPPATIHPAIVKFALRSADYANLGGARRCEEMLMALKEAICDYRANPEMAICRHLDLYIKPMIGFMIEARPLAVSMANAIRALRHSISILPLEVAEHEAIATINHFIDSFLMNRLDLANKLIVSHGLAKIVNGDVILTYGRSTVVRDLLIAAAKEQQKHFQVIVVDSRPFKEGRLLLKELVENSISCTYVNINSLGYVIRNVTKTIVGAAGLYANGTLLSRVGTATVCSLSYRFQVPVIVCSQTVKFSDRSQLDSFVFNEIGDPVVLSQVDHTSSTSPHLTPTFLKGWTEVPSLKMLNILYDVTPSEYITVIITEIGLIPVTSIPVVLREYSSTSNAAPKN